MGIQRFAPRGGRSGHTLLEVMVGFTALVMGLLSFAKVLSMASVFSRTSHDVAVALEGARAMVETLQTEEFAQVFVRYNDSTADDPLGAPGAGFEVEGLTPRIGDADGLVGRILFPTVDGAPTVLRENLFDPRFGTPRDLDADGALDAVNHAADYRILPVVVRVEWLSSGGPSSVELKTLLVETL